MFLLILFMTSICGSRGMSYFKSHPVYTVAVTGQNVTLSCTLQNVQCTESGSHFDLHWVRKMGRATAMIEYMSRGTEVEYNIAGSERYIVSQRGCTWTLHINNGNPNDGRYYNCYIYVKYNEKHESSDIARLSVVDPIDTTVIPSQIDGYDVGQDSTFRCQSRPITEYQLKYIWFTKLKNNNQDGSWQQLTGNNLIAFGENSKTMTMQRLALGENGTAVKCMVFKGSMSFTGETVTGLLLVHRNEVTMETYTGEMTTPQTAMSTSVLLTTSGPLDQQSTPSAPQTSPPLPTKKQDPEPDSNSPSSGCTDSTVTLAGWSLAAVFICLFISSLLYIIVTKRRSKANPNSTRVVQTTQDEDAEAYEEMETQLHGQTASTGRKETAPSSYQELIFK